MFIFNNKFNLINKNLKFMTDHFEDNNTHFWDITIDKNKKDF